MAELQSLGKDNMVSESFWTEAKPKRDDLFCIMVSEDCICIIQEGKSSNARNSDSTLLDLRVHPRESC